MWVKRNHDAGRRRHRRVHGKPITSNLEVHAPQLYSYEREMPLQQRMNAIGHYLRVHTARLWWWSGEKIVNEGEDDQGDSTGDQGGECAAEPLKDQLSRSGHFIERIAAPLRCHAATRAALGTRCEARRGGRVTGGIESPYSSAAQRLHLAV